MKKLFLRFILGPLGWLLGKLASGLKALVEWALSDWRNGPLLVCALMWAVHMVLIAPNLRDERDDALDMVSALTDDLNAAVTAHEATIANHRQAAMAAQKAQASNLARVRNEQAAITERVSDDYEKRIAAVRARAERLRAGTARADPRISRKAGMSGTGTATRGTVEAPDNSGLPAEGNLCPAMNLDERAVATEQAIQLDALIDWNLDQAGVSTQP